MGRSAGVTGSLTVALWVAFETPHLRLAVHMVGTNIWATLGEDTGLLSE